MGLFTPIYMRGNLKPKQVDKALEKVKAINDPDRLCRIAGEAQHTSIREAAVKKLTNAGALLSIAGSDPGLFWCCLSRLKELGEKQGLAKLFIDYKVADDGRSVNAIDREIDRVSGELRGIADQEVFRAVAEAARETRIRAAAVRLLESPAALAGIAMNDPQSLVRQAAIDNPHFNDVGILAQIAGGDAADPDTLRWSAALRLTELAPERAVGPLVTLLKQIGNAKAGKGAQTAVRFLEARYRDAANEEERERIASLPNGKYGSNWNGPCWHEDASVHFDIPR